VGGVQWAQNIFKITTSNFLHGGELMTDDTSKGEVEKAGHDMASDRQK
jgi:hypothetical protein